ncbi:putative pentatricopeptide repeat-containing protein At1g26500 [Andrographis paniculata]|uniref:putative pentatricopeptide repeat-containing protein At1g26500 n=1 Tax=Andrographis paniculata TaxID=175694 RepID=UPI0021E8D5AA|nr:putative pentatricopeptide repeat-containing protein At1g26500 [Andrographis paniculata]XP_051149353.1 putative pentatricopeptide repeat-containing protein At1g26500 [Andrographis paniculata]
MLSILSPQNQMALLAKSRHFIRPRTFKSICTFLHLNQNAQQLPQDPPPNPASGSVRFRENRRNPTPGALASAASAEAPNLMNNFADRTTSQKLDEIINEDHLLRVCTVLYQQQNASDAKLNGKLTKTQFNLSHDFFLQVCNKFPFSWRPIYRFHLFSLSQSNFTHTPTTFNKMLDIVGKSRNIDLFWVLCEEIAKLRLVNIKTYVIALRTLAAARELKKCVEFFHLMNDHGYEYNIKRLNIVVEILCRNKLVVEANHVVVKLRDWIKPDEETYRWIIHGFCDVGDLIEASKIWNLMADEGLKPGTDAMEVMLERFFKNGEMKEGLKLFQSMRTSRMEDIRLSTYRLVIKWLCKRGKTGEAQFLFDEMQKAGIEPDNEIFGSIIYTLTSRGRVKEAYKILEQVINPEVCVYHGMMKGLLRLKKASEATEVFREMVRAGCEPTMHTYVMLLQGHLGKRGRKGEDPLVNFDTIFLGGLVVAGKSYETNKYVERAIRRGVEVPRFDYNKFLHYFSNEEGVVMFETMARKLREVGLFDLADIFERYGLKMATRDRRRS